MQPTHPRQGFLTEPPLTPEIKALFDEDIAEQGYVMNASRVWAQAPAANDALFALLGAMVELAGLTFRQRGVLVSATASTIGDAYCSLAWGNRLATEAGDDVAAGVLRGDDDRLDAVDAALAAVSFGRPPADEPS